jgi:hypothetical protein
VPRRPLSERIAVAIAAVACLVFALGVRDTPVRAPLPPEPTAVPAPSPFERDATLVASVRAVRTADQTSDEAVAHAKVRVFYQHLERFHWVGAAETNEQGRTRIESLPRGVLWITAEADGFARSSTQLVMDEPERQRELVLVPAHELSVTVLDEQESPIEHATVLVSTTDPLPYGALTDKDGEVTLGRLGPAPYAVKASARGYESTTLRGIAAPVTVKLRRLGALLLSVQDSENHQVPGATVTLSGTSLWPARRVTTNDQGQANVHGLLAGSYDLRAVKGDLVSRTELGVVLARGEQRAVLLRLVQGRKVTVFVTDGEGEPIVPVPNADVVIAEGGLSVFPERGRSLADGKVTLGPFEPGPLSATATARDFVGPSVVAVPDGSNTEVRIALQRGGSITGRVVDAFDHPIDGASIEIVGTDFSGLPIAETPRFRQLQAAGFSRALAGPEALLAVGELGVTMGPIPAIPSVASSSDYLLSSDELRRPSGLSVTATGEGEPWVTRYDGTFRAFPVTPGRLRALVRHPAYVEAQSDLVTLAPGGSAEVTVVLRAGGAIEGVVVDRYDRPIGGAHIELLATLGSRVQSTYTADDGAFAFASLPSEVTITVARPESPDRPIVRQHVTVREGKREPLRIVLPEARDAVDVLVVDEQGQYLEGVEVVVASLEPGSPLRRTRFTSPDGRAEFDDARDRELSITTENPGYAPTVEHIAKAPAQVIVVMRRGVLVTGRVTSVRGRVPVAHARVTVVSGGRRRIATTNGEGTWQLADVPEGPVHLTVEAADLPLVLVDRNVVRQARLDRAFDLGEIDLPDAGGISGVVVDQHGDPVIGAQVSTMPISGYLPAAATAKGTAITDKLGRYRLAPVAVGKVILHAFATGVGRGRSEPIEVLRDRDREDTRIRLDRSVNDESTTSSPATLAITLREVTTSIVVDLVAAASEAERAGVMPGDCLVAIDGIKPRDVSDARARLSGPENSDVLLDLERQGKAVRLRTVRELVRR